MRRRWCCSHDTASVALAVAVWRSLRGSCPRRYRPFRCLCATDMISKLRMEPATGADSAPPARQHLQGFNLEVVGWCLTALCSVVRWPCQSLTWPGLCWGQLGAEAAECDVVRKKYDAASGTRGPCSTAWINVQKICKEHDPLPSSSIDLNM